MNVNGEDLILGRVASFVAKKALLGEKVNILNCEKIIITGSKKDVFGKYKNLSDKGQVNQGPYLSRTADRFVRRAVKRMLPYKKARGKEAFKRIMCHIGVPEKFSSQKLEKVGDASVSKLPNVKYVYLKDIAKHLGGKL